MTDTVFDKIIQKKIPAKIVYEDELCIAFDDINPVAKFHIVLIPKNKDGLDRLLHATDKHADILGHLLVKAPLIAKKVGFGEEGYRLVINDGQHGGQTVPHLHLHIIGGQQLTWPPGTGSPEAKKT